MTDFEWFGVAFTATNAVRVLLSFGHAGEETAGIGNAFGAAVPAWRVFAANNALGALLCASSLGRYELAGSCTALLVGCASIVGAVLAGRQRATLQVGARPAGAKHAVPPGDSSPYTMYSTEEWRRSTST